MKKLPILLSLVPTIIFGQSTERQILVNGTAITRLPAISSVTVAPTDTIIVFKGGAWIKTTVGAASPTITYNSPLSITSNTVSITSPLPIINGGTNQSALIVGSSLFFDGTRIQQDNANYFWDDSNNRLGLGTASPGSTLHVNGVTRLGLASTTNASLIFQNSANANMLTINSGVTSASHSWTLPLAQGAASTSLMNDGSGVLSWGMPMAGSLVVGTTTLVSGTSTRLLFEGAGNVLQENAGMTFDATTTGLNLIGNSSSSSDYSLKVNTSTIPQLWARNDGKIAINGTDFEGTLTISDDIGNGVWETSTGVSRFNFKRTTADGISAGIIRYMASDNTVKWNIGTSIVTGADNLEFNAGSLGNRMLIERITGNVIIGAGAPSAKLHVIGTGSTSATYTAKFQNSANADIFDIRDDKKIIYTDGSQAAGYILQSDANGLATWVPEGGLLHVISTPTTTATVTLTNNYINIVNPAGTIAAATLQFPNSPSNNDFVEVTFSQIITTVTYTAGTGGATIKGQINGVVGGQKRWDYDSGTNTWY